MKKLFTTDIPAAQDFLAKIDFPNLYPPRGYQEGNMIRPRDQFELVEGKGKSQVYVQVGMLKANEFLNMIMGDFGFTHIDTDETGQIAQTANFKTPFGFTFHVHVVFA